MNFFCKEKDYDIWVKDIGIDQSNIFCLDSLEALRVSKMIFEVYDI